MNKSLVFPFIVSAVVAGLAVPALAQPPTTSTTATTTTLVAIPIQGNRVNVMLYVDTVQSTHPSGGVLPAVGCSITNLFRQGNGVVFRVWGVATPTGFALTPANVKYAYVTVPNPASASAPTIVKLNYGVHGTGPTARAYWTAAWNVPLDYPVGVVPFRVVVKTTANKFGEFDQANLPTPSQLTITP